MSCLWPGYNSRARLRELRFQPLFVFAVPCSIEEVKSTRKLELHQLVVTHHSFEFGYLAALSKTSRIDSCPRLVDGNAGSISIAPYWKQFSC